MLTFREFLERKEQPYSLSDRNKWEKPNPISDILKALGNHLNSMTPAERAAANVADITSRNRLQDYYNDKSTKTTKHFMDKIQDALEAVNLWDYARHIVLNWDKLYPRPEQNIEEWKYWLNNAEQNLKAIIVPLFKKYPKAMHQNFLGYLDTYPLYLKNPKYPINNKGGHKLAWNNDIAWELKHLTGIS